MAATLSHAAGQERYEVREILEGQALGHEVRHDCRDYVQAVEFAFSNSCSGAIQPARDSFTHSKW
jgi:hypothetical protein